MSKFFVIDPSINPVDSKSLAEIENRKVEVLGDSVSQREQKNLKLLAQKDTLNAVSGRVIIKINKDGKNSHSFENGTVIRRERQFNEFNRRQTEPVNAIVISAEHIPEGSEILIGHNALHDSNRIFDYKNASETSDIRYFSIPEAECFAWRDKDGELKPMKDFEFALRVFEPYTGSLENILPTIIKDTLYITTGHLKGYIVHTLKACDYTIIFQGTNGREDQVIRCRHSETPGYDREEIIAVSHGLTERFEKGNLLIGLSPEDCKKLSSKNEKKKINPKVKYKSISVL